jgi:hypothetical protein
MLADCVLPLSAGRANGQFRVRAQLQQLPHSGRYILALAVLNQAGDMACDLPSLALAAGPWELGFELCQLVWCVRVNLQWDGRDLTGDGCAFHSRRGG